MTVYIVTSGEYSDYGIDAIFSTYDKAEKFIALKNDEKNSYLWHEEYNIEEYAVDDCEIISKNPMYYHYEYLPMTNTIRDKQPTFRYGNPSYESRVFHYWNTNKDLDTKVLQDAYYKWKAENMLDVDDTPYYKYVCELCGEFGYKRVGKFWIIDNCDSYKGSETWGNYFICYDKNQHLTNDELTQRYNDCCVEVAKRKLGG